MQSCPKCNKKHHKFPRSCYYDAHSDNTHAVIAQLASYGNVEQKEWAKQVKANWDRMNEYARANFPNNVKDN